MRWLLVALALAGCTRSGSGDSLVVVTVGASPALSNLAVLHTTSMAGGETILHDVGGNAAPFSLGGGVTKTFGVDVPASITGKFSIHVAASNGSGKVLGAGDGSTTLQPGHIENITIVLGSATVDGGTDGGSGGMDGGTDGGSDGMVPVIVVEPVYVGSGGSAASHSQQLSINIGGIDTVGATSAPSSAQFTSGFFASQTPR
jgi:hypothetical protein